MNYEKIKQITIIVLVFVTAVILCVCVPKVKQINEAKKKRWHIQPFAMSKKKNSTNI